MRWQRLGKLFCPRDHSDWMHSHAANPLPLRIDSDTIRVFFSCRDRSNQSHVGYVDLAANRGFRVIQISREPALSPGRLGTFDDSGVSIGCLTQTDHGLALYYMGWNLKVKVPWGNAIGVAFLDRNLEKFERRHLAPILDRSETDPYSLSYPFVFKHDELYKMYYGSHLSWGEESPEMTHVLKYAESKDGFKWRVGGPPLFELLPGEYALSRPWVRQGKKSLEMFFARRGSQDAPSYRIGYATSLDGVSWTRQSEGNGLQPSSAGWDSEMLGYPATFEHAGETYLLYSGNQYGREGFGLARREG